VLAGGGEPDTSRPSMGGWVSEGMNPKLAPRASQCVVMPSAK